MGAERTLVETPAPEVVAPAPAGPGPALPLATAEVVSLQRTAGNRATIRALAGRPSRPRAGRGPNCTPAGLEWSSR